MQSLETVKFLKKIWVGSVRWLEDLALGEIPYFLKYQLVIQFMILIMVLALKM